MLRCVQGIPDKRTLLGSALCVLAQWQAPDADLRGLQHGFGAVFGAMWASIISLMSGLARLTVLVAASIGLHLIQAVYTLFCTRVQQ